MIRKKHLVSLFCLSFMELCANSFPRAASAVVVFNYNTKEPFLVEFEGSVVKENIKYHASLRQDQNKHIACVYKEHLDILNKKASTVSAEKTEKSEKKRTMSQVDLLLQAKLIHESMQIHESIAQRYGNFPLAVETILALATNEGIIKATESSIDHPYSFMEANQGVMLSQGVLLELNLNSKNFEILSKIDPNFSEPFKGSTNLSSINQSINYSLENIKSLWKKSYDLYAKYSKNLDNTSVKNELFSLMHVFALYKYTIDSILLTERALKNWVIIQNNKELKKNTKIITEALTQNQKKSTKETEIEKKYDIIQDLLDQNAIIEGFAFLNNEKDINSFHGRKTMKYGFYPPTIKEMFNDTYLKATFAHSFPPPLIKMITELKAANNSIDIYEMIIQSLKLTHVNLD